MEKKSSDAIQSQIVVIGAQIPSLRGFATFDNELSVAQSSSPNGKWSNPQMIANHNGLIALIDEKNDLWILDNSFSIPLNITELLRMKAKRLFLGEGQLIFENRKRGWVVVNWSGKIDVCQEKLKKVSIPHSAWSNAIDAYFLEQQCDEGSMWYYSTIKKVQNTLKIYLINAQRCEIVGFPQKKTIRLPQKIAGMSLGKYHGLCWTVSGRIFSWGCKNLAMGLKHYNKAYYDQPQQIAIGEPIFKALAGTNYSIALSINGKLYEWGISKVGQPILTPRVLSIKNKKFLDIKGFQNAFVGLTSANQLYCWGKGAQRYCQNIVPSDDIYLIPKEKNVKIFDYHLEENSIITLIGHNNGQVNKDEQHYFSEVVRKVSHKWMPHRLHKDATSTSYSKFRNQVKQNEVSIQIIRKNEDYIDRLITNQINKQDYFSIVQNQQAMFRKIMEEKTTRSTTKAESASFINDTTHNIIKDTTTRNINKLSNSNMKSHRKVESARQTPNIAYELQNSNRIVRQFEAEQAELRNKRKRCKMPVGHKRQNLSYEARLQAVMIKKMQIQQKKKLQYMQNMEKRLSLEKKQQQQARQTQIQQRKTVVGKLKKFMTKIYLCQLLKNPIDYGREIKINELISNSNSKAVTSNMKTSLLQNRAVAFLKTLQNVEPCKYELVAKVIVRAVERWRMKKDKLYKTQIVNEMVKNSIKKKIQIALSHVWLASRKIQKVVKWISQQQKERTMQLKMLWKKSLLLYLKPTASFENKKASICREDMNYKLGNDRYKNPRFLAYLGSSPITKLKLRSNVTLDQLQKNYAESLEVSVSCCIFKETNKKGVSWAQNEVFDIRFQCTSKQQRRSFTMPTGPIDILLYSQHYDCFYKPKNYQINIPDCMKQSEKWIAEQKKILHKLIKEILFKQWKKFYEDRLGYQQKLAYFIKDNYETLTSFRWKYLIEFNKIKDDNNLTNAKKEKELRHLLRNINSESLLSNDVIPQKHRVLEYAKLLKGSPPSPSLEIVLSQQQFKKQFKTYYENVSNKAKNLRKFYN